MWSTRTRHWLMQKSLLLMKLLVVLLVCVIILAICSREQREAVLGFLVSAVGRVGVLIVPVFVPMV